MKHARVPCPRSHSMARVYKVHRTRFLTKSFPLLQPPYKVYWKKGKNTLVLNKKIENVQKNCTSYRFVHALQINQQIIRANRKIIKNNESKEDRR